MKKQILTVLAVAIVAGSMSTINAASAIQQISSTAQLDTIVSNSEKPVVLYVYGARCPHCKRFSPKVDKVANQLQGDFTFVKAESTQGYQVAEAFGVRGVPYIAVIKNGEKAASKSGLNSEQELISFVRSNE